ncbi:MAG TPA: hypothetical protein VF334_15305, partial [Polyangia bacterium]
MPRTFQGLGPDSLVPKPKPSALAGLKLGAEEGFVLSRVDGRLTVGQICLLVPFDAEVTATILGQLMRVGAVDIPGAVVPEPPPATPVAEPPRPRSQTPAPTAGAASPPMIDGLELTVEQARRIDEFFDSLSTRDAFELLEVTRTADKKE